MRKLLTDENSGAISARPVPENAAGSALLLEVLWRRRWSLAVAMILCIAGACAYLVTATRIYSASATVLIEQHAPKAFSESQGYQAQSETFMQTQADVLRSAPVLGRALEKVNFRDRKTFATAEGDVVAWLRRGNGFAVEAARKSDVVTVSMESPWPQEAAEFVDAVVHAYMTELSQQKRALGTEMVGVLQQERDELLKKRDQCIKEQIQYKQQKHVISFRDDKANTVIERMNSLSTKLAEAEIAAIELRAQLKSIKAALATPAGVTSFVTSLQSQGRDFGDREFDDIRTQLLQQSTALAMTGPILGNNHPRAQVLIEGVEALKKRLAAKEWAIAEARMLAVAAQTAAAEEKETELRTALEKQQRLALELTPAAAEYAKLETDVDRLQKKIDLLESRIAEINVNAVKGGPHNVQLLEPARVMDRPVKPKKVLVLGAALMAGWVLGIGLALLREWQDARLRTPEEILTVLGMPVIAMVPRMNMRLSPATRGQLVALDARSPVAEAYRSARTALHLGVASHARTILMASPMEGDGKSTTASNLAIAFAQAGERTLLVDCDLRQPVQHLILEADGRVGLTNVLAGDAKLKDAITGTRVPGLYLLSCGPVPVNPSELLTSKKFASLMRTLSDSFDRIIIDSPPLMRFTDARILAASADVTVLVLRMNRSMRPLGALALTGLAQVGANVLGAIANDVPLRSGLRIYGASWQYATRTDRMLPAASGEREHGHNGETAGKLSWTPQQALAINEPDWNDGAE